MNQFSDSSAQKNPPHHHYLLSILLLVVCLAAATFENSAHAQSPESNASLVEQLRSTIESEGAEAAGKWFQEYWPANKSQYEAIDSQDLMMLMSEYIGAGDNAAAQVVGEITATVLQDTMTDAMNTHAPGMAAEMEKMREAEAEQQMHTQAVEQDNNLQIEQQSRGQSRDDLSRFKGLYGQSNGRLIFVAESCDGYLVAGPMWADVPAWWMRSATDHVFTYSDSFISLAFDFKLDKSGQAVQLVHDLEGLPSPIPKTAALPVEYSDCISRPTR